MATDVHRPVTGPAVHVEGLTRSFDGRTVIDDLRLDIAPGEFVALLGRSGCGKSTLLRILAGLDRDIEGTALVPRRRAVAFQAPRLMPWKKVWRNVLLGLPGRPERARAERALDEVGLGHRAHAWPKTLSGGEAQRASPPGPRPGPRARPAAAGRAVRRPRRPDPDPGPAPGR